MKNSNGIFMLDRPYELIRFSGSQFEGSQFETDWVIKPLFSTRLPITFPAAERLSVLSFWPVPNDTAW